jgi:GNAT superfamily N-acetyltransferase
MMRSQVKACDAIAAVSEPWNTLNERIDFLRFIRLKQVYVCTIKDVHVVFLIFTPEPVFAKGGYLRAIGVDPAMRRRGIGGKLLAFAESVRAELLSLCIIVQP